MKKLSKHQKIVILIAIIIFAVVLTFSLISRIFTVYESIIMSLFAVAMYITGDKTWYK